MVDYTVTNSVLAFGDVRVRVHRFRRNFVDENDPTFVLVHGIGVNSKYFLDLAHDLVAYGDVVSMDLPGFGHTPRPDHPLSIAGFAAVVHWVMRYEEVKNPVVLGHSMGAQVVTELAARDPQLVDRIMLIGPPVNAAERTALQVGFRFMQSSVYEPWDVAAFALTAYLKSGLVWFMETLPAMLTYPIELRLEDAGARTVLMSGEHDHVAPRHWLRDLSLAARQRTGRQARIMEVEGGAHSVIVHHSEEVARALIDLAKEPRPRIKNLPAQPLLNEATGVESANQSVFESLAEHTVRGPSVAKRVGVTTIDYARSARMKVRHVLERAALIDGPVPEDYRQPGAPVALGIPGVLESWRFLETWAQALYDDGWDVHLLPQMRSMNGPLHMLSRRLDAYLEEHELTNVYLFSHSKGSLVGKMSMVGAHAERIAGLVALGAPWAGSSVASIAPTIMGVDNLRPSDPIVRHQFMDQRVNNRIVTIQAQWDQHVPAGSWLPGAHLVTIGAWGHNWLLESPVATRALVDWMGRLRDGNLESV
ncbi:MAG: alpha/beta fold hydrolase [Actinomycetaceae bacterium]|nr:alpha/beta fold hydrolase [Actinomycetaceae bacterium]